MQKHIVLIEDEPHLTEIIKLNLELEKFQVTCYQNGKHIIDFLSTHIIDLIILDIMLPGDNGIIICNKIKKQYPHIPILFMSAKNTSNDRLLGLKAGGDDYMIKPFEIDELLFRVNKLIPNYNTPQQLHLNDCIINTNNLEITLPNKKIITLTNREMALLKLFFSAPNTFITREKILKEVWQYEVTIKTRTIDNVILKFRKIFEHAPKYPKVFISKRGLGYMLKLDK